VKNDLSVLTTKWARIFTLYTLEKIFRNTVGKSGVVVIIYAQISARSTHGCVGGTVANWPIFRPQNSNRPSKIVCGLGHSAA
jgi:hypothetical protein